MNLLLVALALLPQWGLDSAPVDPHDYLSPDGNHRLHVESIERDGQGPGIYTMYRGDEQLWRVELPFHMEEVFLADDVQAFGYGKVRSEARRRELVVALLGADGKVVTDERTPETMSRYPDSPADPRPRGLVPDPAHDRIWVRVADPDVNVGLESWWGYRLSTGERLATLQPGKGLKSDFGFGGRKNHVRQAVLVPDTDLVLIHWWVTDNTDYSWHYGHDEGLFALMTADGELVWKLELPLDYTVTPEEGGEQADDALALALRDQDLILGTGPGARFELRWVRAERRVSYAVRAEGEGWVVEEVGRAPWVEPPGPSELAAAEPKVLELQQLGEVQLERIVRGRSSPLQAAEAWCVEGDQLFVVRAARGGDFERARVDLDTLAEEVKPLPALPEPAAGEGSDSVTWHDLGEDEWLVARTCYRKTGNVEECWVVDAELGEVLALSGRSLQVGGQAPSVEAGARMNDGVLVLLVTYRYEYTSSPALLGLDPEGELLWAVGEDYEDETKLFSPEDLTVLGGDRIVVLDNIAKRLQLYDGAGKHLGNVDLEQAWGKEPRYPTDVKPDHRGGLLVRDFSGSTPWWRMDLEAGTSMPLSPAFADGRVPKELLRFLRAGTDGRLWSSDGFELLELDDQAQVARSLDGEPDPLELHAYRLPVAPGDGRVYVQDTRTGTLHVWSEDGRKLHEGALPKEELDHVQGWLTLAAVPGGTVWVELDDGSIQDSWVGWDAEGAYLGRSPVGKTRGQASDGRVTWTWGFEESATLHGADGEVLAEVSQAPDRTWLQGIDAVSFAPDGRAWIWEPSRSVGARARTRVLVCGSDGEVEEVLELPNTPWARQPSHAGSWVLPSPADPLLLSRAVDDTWQAWTLAIELERDASLAFSADGRELLHVHPDLRLTRYALPDLGEK